MYVRIHIMSVTFFILKYDNIHHQCFVFIYKSILDNICDFTAETHQTILQYKLGDIGRECYSKLLTFHMMKIKSTMYGTCFYNLSLNIFIQRNASI